MGTLDSLENHQLAWQGDDLEAFVPDAGGADDALLGVATDDVIVGCVFVHHAQEHLFDTRTFLINGIVEGIDQVVDTLDDALLVHQLGGGEIIAGQFLAIVGEVLELDTFGVGEEQQVDGLVDWLQFYLLIVVIHEEKTVVLCDQQSAQLCPGSFDAELFEQGRANSPQQEVIPVCCLQMASQTAQLLGYFLVRKQ